MRIDANLGFRWLYRRKSGLTPPRLLVEYVSTYTLGAGPREILCSSCAAFGQLSAPARPELLALAWSYCGCVPYTSTTMLLESYYGRRLVNQMVTGRLL